MLQCNNGITVFVDLTDLSMFTYMILIFELLSCEVVMLKMIQILSILNLLFKKIILQCF